MSPRKKHENSFLEVDDPEPKSALQFALKNLVLGKCNISLYLAPEFGTTLDETGEKLRAGLPAELQSKFTDHVFIELLLTAALDEHEKDGGTSLIKRALEGLIERQSAIGDDKKTRWF